MSKKTVIVLVRLSENDLREYSDSYDTNMSLCQLYESIKENCENCRLMYIDIMNNEKSEKKVADMMISEVLEQNFTTVVFYTTYKRYHDDDDEEEEEYHITRECKQKFLQTLENKAIEESSREIENPPNSSKQITLSELIIKTQTSDSQTNYISNRIININIDSTRDETIEGNDEGNDLLNHSYTNKSKKNNNSNSFVQIISNTNRMNEDNEDNHRDSDRDCGRDGYINGYRDGGENEDVGGDVGGDNGDRNDQHNDIHNEDVGTIFPELKNEGEISHDNYL